MIINMLIGFPDQRPGGLLLTVMLTAGAFAAALIVGYLYAVVCGNFPKASVPLQALLAVMRGIPLLLLIFFVVQTTPLPLGGAGFLAVLIYASTNVGEVLRTYRSAYPAVLTAQSRVLGIGGLREELSLRAPWTLLRSLDTLGTHLISLLKDTGALTIVAVGELTTIARVLSAGATVERWVLTVSAAAALYLAATGGLIAGIRALKKLAGHRGVRLE